MDTSNGIIKVTAVFLYGSNYMYMCTYLYMPAGYARAS